MSFISLFNNISTFVGYLMQKKKNRSGIIQHIAGGIRRFMPFPWVLVGKLMQ